MLTLNGSSQYIIWSHDALASEPPQIGDHKGTLESYILIPGLTIGLTDYLNFSYSQAIGVRSMHWDGKGDSDHHRSETSLTDYKNGIGGPFGDARLKLRYLYKNTGMKEGNRIYFGLGVLIPSKNVLNESPFIPDEPHRHFSLSDGAYKGLLEFQIFNKRFTNPIFYGLTTNIEIPISESQYEYMPGISYSFTSSLIYNNMKYSPKKSFNFIPSGFSFGLSFSGLTEASWHGVSTPNSESKILVPSFGGIWKLGEGSASISLRKPIFISGVVGSDDDPLNNETNAFEIVFGYRRNLGYMIPWL